MKTRFKTLPNQLKSATAGFQFQLAEEGVSGTYFVTQNHQPLAVFKDSSEDPLSPNNPKLPSKLMRFGSYFFKPAWFFTAFEHCVTGQSYVSDYVSYKVAKKIQFKHIIIPKTKIAEEVCMDNNTSKKGSLLKWIPDAISLGTYTNIFRKLCEKPKDMDIPFEAFEEMAVFDYITGNMDRKAGNVLVRKKDSYLYMIDNSWAFSPLQGETLAINQYAWGSFPLLSKRTFSSETKRKIRTIYLERYKLAQIAYETYCERLPPLETQAISHQRAMCFLHRIEMLYFLICENNATFSQLSKVRFEDTFSQINKETKSHFLSSTWNSKEKTPEKTILLEKTIQIEEQICKIDQHKKEQARILSEYTAMRIREYQFWNKNVSHLPLLTRLFDRERGLKRAKFYLDALHSSQSLLCKQIVIYALLASNDGKTLQSKFNRNLKPFLKDQLQERCLRAAGGDERKKQEYLDELNKLVGKIVETANNSEKIKIPRYLLLKLDSFERKVPGVTL